MNFASPARGFSSPPCWHSFQRMCWPRALRPHPLPGIRTRAIARRGRRCLTKPMPSPSRVFRSRSSGTKETTYADVDGKYIWTCTQRRREIKVVMGGLTKTK